MSKTGFGPLVLVILASLLLPSNTAYAYLDPGTGSYLLQCILAMAVGGLVAVKTFWIQIKNFTLRLFGRRQPGEGLPGQGNAGRDKDQL